MLHSTIARSEFRRGHRMVHVAIVGLALFAFACGAWINRFGPNTDIDGAEYYSTGVRFGEGLGITEPDRTQPPRRMIWYGPMYPVAIAGLYRAGLPVFFAIGYLQAALWGAMVLVVGYATWSFVGAGWAMLAAAGIATQVGLLRVCAQIYSEPLFLLLLSGSLLALGWWVRDRRGSALIVAALLAMLANLTRYAGVSLALAGAAVVLAGHLVEERRRWLRRGARGMVLAAIFALVVALPAELWVKINYPMSDASGSPSIAGRALAWHPIDFYRTYQGVLTLESFFVPRMARMGVWEMRWMALSALMVAAAAVFLIARFVRPRPRLLEPGRGPWALAGVSLMFVLVYGVFVLASISLADDQTPLDQRILSPMIPAGVMMLACLGAIAHRGLQRFGQRPIAWALPTAAIALCLVQSYATAARVLERRPTDLNYTPLLPHPLLEAVARLPGGAPLACNLEAGFFLATGRRADTLPTLPRCLGPYAKPGSDRDPAAAARALAKALDALERKVPPRGAWIVLWDCPALGDSRCFGSWALGQRFAVVDHERFADGELLKIRRRR